MFFFKFRTSLCINCYCINACICEFISISLSIYTIYFSSFSIYLCIEFIYFFLKYNLLNQYNLACTYIFRADYLEMYNQLVCSLLGKATSAAPSIILVVEDWVLSPVYIGNVVVLFQFVFGHEKTFLSLLKSVENYLRQFTAERYVWNSLFHCSGTLSWLLGLHGNS